MKNYLMWYLDLPHGNHRIRFNTSTARLKKKKSVVCIFVFVCMKNTTSNVHAMPSESSCVSAFIFQCLFYVLIFDCAGISVFFFILFLNS